MLVFKLGSELSMCIKIKLGTLQKCGCQEPNSVLLIQKNYLRVRGEAVSHQHGCFSKVP